MKTLREIRDELGSKYSCSDDQFRYYQFGFDDGFAEAIKMLNEDCHASAGAMADLLESKMNEEKK